MDHSEAIQLKAAERYLLGDLTGVLLQEYEEHFFSCPECAQALGLGVVFIENARQVLAAEAAPAPASVPAPIRAAPEPVPPATPAKQNWFASFLRPAFAAPVLAALLVAVVYQSAVLIPRLNRDLSRANAPQALRTFSLLNQNSRGAALLIVGVPPDHSFGLYLDIPPGHPFAFYDCQLQDAAGKADVVLKVSAEEASQTIELLVPPNRLQPGRHVLVVRGLASLEGPAGPEISRYPFRLEFLK